MIQRKAPGESGISRERIGHLIKLAGGAILSALAAHDVIAPEKADLLTGIDPVILGMLALGIYAGIESLVGYWARARADREKANQATLQFAKLAMSGALEAIDQGETETKIREKLRTAAARLEAP